MPSFGVSPTVLLGIEATFGDGGAYSDATWGVLAGFAATDGMFLSDSVAGDTVLSTFNSSGTLRLGIDQGTASLVQLTSNLFNVADSVRLNAFNASLTNLTVGTLYDPTAISVATLSGGAIQVARMVSLLDASGTPTIGLSSGSITIPKNVIFGNHLVSNESTAPICAVQTGAGSGATATLATGSTDVKGVITLNAKSSGGAAGAWVEITFTAAYTNAPVVVLMNGSSVITATEVYVESTTTGFTVYSTTAPTTATVVLNYIVIG